MKETLHPSLQHEPKDKQPAAFKGYSSDDSLVGSLLSVLIPEPDQYDANEPMSKKRKYGRQVKNKT